MKEDGRTTAVAILTKDDFKKKILIECKFISLLNVQVQNKYKYK